MKLEVLTIVFTDIKDYTSKTSGQSRQANERLLARFAAVVKPMVRVFNGSVVKAIGDAYLLTFRSPTDSLLCAMAVLDQLAHRNAGLAKDERFELRFAINAGEVRVDRRDVFGEPVNIAARLEGLAGGGEIYFSEAVYLMMNKSEVPFEKVGRHKLKGIAEEVGVYRVPRLSEVGTYKLQPAEDSARDEPARAGKPLPYGGLALQKVHSHLTGLALEADGAFYLGGALSEIHYTAASRAAGLARGAWWRKALGPGLYLGAAAWGVLRLLLGPASYRGLWVRARKASKRLGEDAAYRKKALGRLTLLALLLAAALLGWQQYRAVQEANAYKALAEQRAAIAAQAQAREAATRKALSKEKKALTQEKKKFHFPW